jgi:hypothetical protein
VDLVPNNNNKEIFNMLLLLNTVIKVEKLKMDFSMPQLLDL